MPPGLVTRAPFRPHTLHGGTPDIGGSVGTTGAAVGLEVVGAGVMGALVVGAGDGAGEAVGGGGQFPHVSGQSSQIASSGSHRVRAANGFCDSHSQSRTPRLVAKEAVESSTHESEHTPQDSLHFRWARLGWFMSQYNDRSVSLWSANHRHPRKPPDSTSKKWYRSSSQSSNRWVIRVGLAVVVGIDVVGFAVGAADGPVMQFPHVSRQMAHASLPTWHSCSTKIGRRDMYRQSRRTPLMSNFPFGSSSHSSEHFPQVSSQMLYASASWLGSHRRECKFGLASNQMHF